MILNLRYFTEFSNRMPLTQATLQTAGPGSQAPAGLAGLVSPVPWRLLGAFSLRTLLQGAAGARHSCKTLGNSNSFITAPRGRSRSDSPFNRPGPRGAVRRRTWLGAAGEQTSGPRAGPLRATSHRRCLPSRPGGPPLQSAQPSRERVHAALSVTLMSPRTLTLRGPRRLRFPADAGREGAPHTGRPFASGSPVEGGVWGFPREETFKASG